MSTPVTVLIYTALVFATSAIGSLTGIGGGVVRKPVFDAMGDFNAAEIAFLNVVTVLAMSLVSILRQSKNFRFEGFGRVGKDKGNAVSKKNNESSDAAEKTGSDGAETLQSGRTASPRFDPEENRTTETNSPVKSTDASSGASDAAASIGGADQPAGTAVFTKSFEASGETAAFRETPEAPPEEGTSAKTADKRPVLSLKNLLLLSVGSVVGGVGGEVLFAALVKGAPDSEVKLVQNVVLLILVAAVLGYMLFKAKIPTARLKHPGWYVAAGLLLGILASFLGIGGGPMNLAVLMLMFSMSTKEAAYSSLAVILVSQISKLVISAVSGTILVVTAPLVYASVGFMTAGAVVGGLIGSVLSKKLSDKAVTAAFDVLQLALIAVVIYNIVRAAGSL